MSGPSPKRRRLMTLAADESAAVPVTLLHRPDDEIRSALQDLHATLDQYGDVLVCVEGEHGTKEEFACVSALLAASSRPLGAMLFGSLRATTPHTGDERPRLRLRFTEPEHFQKLLLFIHGQDIPLEVEDAFQMHHVADFYEVLGLRDLCCRFLIDSLRPHNCCHLLSRAHEVHCEPLVQRCLDLLTLDFIAVVEHDGEYPSLNPATLHAIASRDELVCAEEFEVFEAIATWYERQPSAEKYAALLELLPLVRWSLVREERRAQVFEHASRLRPPASVDSESASPYRKGDVSAKVAQVHSGSNSNSETSGLVSATEGDPLRLLTTLFPPAEAATPPQAGVLPAPPRQYSWGQLIARHAPSQGGAPTEPDRVHKLQSTKEYMVGRSRKSDIRIGHQAPMPYISSQHCRIFHSIRWPDEGSSGAWVSDGDEREPRLQAWLEDLSQNGTFINGQLVGRNKHQPLSDGDRIEMVFPQGRQPPQSGSSFPVFTYRPSARPSTPLSSLAAAGTPSRSADEGDTGASQ